MTAHALMRLKMRFGLTGTTMSDVLEVACRCGARRGTVLLSMSAGEDGATELHKVSISGVEVVAVYKRRTHSIATFVPVDKLRRPKRRTRSHGAKLDAVTRRGKVTGRRLRAVGREEDLDEAL